MNLLGKVKICFAQDVLAKHDALAMHKENNIDFYLMLLTSDEYIYCL